MPKKNEISVKHSRSEAAVSNNEAKRTRSTTTTTTTTGAAAGATTRTPMTPPALPLGDTATAPPNQQQDCSLSISNARRALTLMVNAQRGQNMISEGQKMITEGQRMVAIPHAELESLLYSSSRKIQNGLVLRTDTDGDSQTTLEDVPDDSISLIFSFLFRMEKEDEERRDSCFFSSKPNARNKKKTFAICSVEIGKAIRTFAFVSHAIRQSLLYHLQNSPVRLKEERTWDTDKGLKNVAMVCKLKMKLRDAEYTTLTPLGKGIIVHLMKSCDISSVNKLSLNINPNAHETNFNKMVNAARKMGIPRDDENLHLLVSNAAFHQKLASVFFEKRCAPKILTLLELNLSSNFHSPLLTNLGVDLEKLVLSAEGQNGSCKICSDLMLAIEALPKLKYFELKVPDMRRSETEYLVHRLKSSSIEEMKIPGNLCAGGTLFSCPSLTTLTLVGDIYDEFFPFVTHCPPSVKHLRLHGISKITTLAVLEVEIRALPQLETLTFDKGDARCHNANSIAINSQSLQVIDTINAPEPFIVTSCVCPMLKKFRMKVQWEIYENHVEDFNGQYASTGFESRGITVTQGIHPKKTFIEHVDFDNDDDDRVVEFEAGERDFVGTIVPDSCIVEVQLEINLTNVGTYM